MVKYDHYLNFSFKRKASLDRPPQQAGVHHLGRRVEWLFDNGIRQLQAAQTARDWSDRKRCLLDADRQRTSAHVRQQCRS